MCTLVDLIVSCKFLKLSSLFFILFSLCSSDWLHAAAQSSNPLILSCICSTMLLNPFIDFFFILQHGFLLGIFYVSITFGIFTLVMTCFHVLLSMIIFWTPHWRNHLFPFPWYCFLEILLLEHTLLFLHFPWLSMLVSVHDIKQSPLQVLTDWFHVEDKPFPSAWPKLLLTSQILLII